MDAGGGSVAARMTVYWPARVPVVTEEAGTRGGTHSGMDLAAERGDPVLAPVDGVAVYVGGDGAAGRLWLGSGWLYPNGEGRTVDIRRADGLISRVGHLDGYAIKPGDTVKAGQVIGYAGDSGYSTGVHIHWELRWDRAWSGGSWINPRTVTPQIYAAPTAAPGKRRKRKMDYACVMVEVRKGIFNGKVFCLGNGEEHNVQAESTYINNIAKTYQCGPTSIVTKSHFDAITRELAATRKRHDARR